MKQTNYHLYDFMDFSQGQCQNETLWKAWQPTHVEEHGGDIIITIPYQKQLQQDDMAPDTTVAQEEHTLTVRAYGNSVLRLFTTMSGDAMTDSDDMLLLQLDHVPLHLEGTTIIDAAGRKRGLINLEAPPLDHWSDLLPPPQPAPEIIFYPDGDESKGVALSDDHFSPPRYDALPLGYVKNGDNREERATISFKCAADECFAGTGERVRKMDLSGQTFQLKNQDGQGVNNRRCYKNIPFYISSHLYGAYFHTSYNSKLSLADHSTRSVQFLCDRATIDVFLIGGSTLEDILRRYRQITGFPQMPPLWSFGIWMSRMTYFSADEVEEICSRLREEHYPCDVIHLDTGWFRTDWLCEWKFNPERFPDPEAFIHRLAEKGFKVSLWQLPYVAKGAEQLEEARENHYISCQEEQQASEGSNFSALDYAGTIDFTYPKATEWYKGLLKNLLDMGVKCIKTDFGENIHMDGQYHAMKAEELNNLYALLYQRAAWEVTREVTGDGIIWARAGWSGCQRYPIHWGGDSASTWDGMAGSLKGGLHLGLSGFAFWSHDVPGFHSVPDFMNSPLDEKVYVRWTQFGVFTSHIRYHGTCKREPWHYPSIAPIVKRWWRLRYRLIPYIMEQSRKACEGGMPVLQALLLHHPTDRQCWHIDDEYYFGHDFLVCPVMSGDNRRDIYLPEGVWVDFFTGEPMEGNRWHYGVETPLDEMPVYVRRGARISIYPTDVDSTDDMDLAKAIQIEITHDFKGYKI